MLMKVFNIKIERSDILKYKCKICGYIYDPKDNNGIEFKDLPEDWVCPLCGATKTDFEVVAE